VKQVEGKNVYFFTTNLSTLPENAQQTELPSGYEATMHGTTPMLKKK